MSCVPAGLHRDFIERCTMKYLCLVYHDEQAAEAMSESEMRTGLGEMIAFREEIMQSGHHVASERLCPTRMATTVRNRNGKVIKTDGPFAETKEQLGGFYLVEARDFDEALESASRIPATRWGTVEVRPVWT
jgi:hypothetical protein